MLRPLLRQVSPESDTGCVGIWPRARALLSESLPLAVGTPLFPLSRYLDVIILGLFAPMNEVAVYAVASRVAMLGSLGLRAAAPIASPLIAERFVRGDLAGIEKVAFLAAAMATLHAAVFAVIVLVAGHLLLGLFGASYVDAYLLLLIISAGYGVNAVVGVPSQLLIMTQHQKPYVRTLLVSVAVNAALNLALIPTHGAYGAAYATMISTLILCAVNATRVARLLGINPTVINPRLLAQVASDRAAIGALLHASFSRRGQAGVTPHLVSHDTCGLPSMAATH
jgi:O-antigen/teichoic acid export membrane protein